jgi:hypothetical protein
MSYTVEEALLECGGFGKFQLISLLVYSFANGAACFLLNSIAFLTVLPIYKCKMGEVW